MVNIRLVGSSKDELERAMDNLTQATGGAGSFRRLEARSQRHFFGVNRANCY